MNEERVIKQFALTPNLGELICEALGIASDQCTKIVITLDSEPSLVTVEATIYATNQIVDIDWKAELGKPIDIPKDEGNEQRV